MAYQNRRNSQSQSFNPLPAPEYREILEAARHIRCRVKFQSAPCTRVQGDSGTSKPFVSATQVSIRSLHQSTGRFHPLDSTKATQQVSIRSLHQSTGRFQQLWRPAISCLVSIRSLHQSTGRSYCTPLVSPVIVVSIRSLHQSTGRFLSADVWWLLYTSFNPLPAPEYREILAMSIEFFPRIEFQSAPCTRVQGDQLEQIILRPNQKVSIRSLHQSTGRLSLLDIQQVVSYVSIRSLHQSTGRCDFKVAIVGY